jgi:hypothetical protein
LELLPSKKVLVTMAQALYRDGCTHNIGHHLSSTLRHHSTSKQKHKADVFEALSASLYENYLPTWIAGGSFYHEQMYPTPPPTASPESIDDDASDMSTCSEDHLMSEDAPTNPFPQISRPIELLQDSYDCVVIGSGYGGSVAASRMARAGESVCLLERGEERWPGEYPTGTVETVNQYRVTGDLIPSSLGGIGINTGNPTGMYHLILGHDQNVIVANGEC